MPKFWNVAAAALLLTFSSSQGEAKSFQIAVKFQNGVLCDKVTQIEEIVSQYGQIPLNAALDKINARTGKISCGVVKKPMVWLMEPLRIVATPGGKLAIVKLTSRSGFVQYAWRERQNHEPPGHDI